MSECGRVDHDPAPLLYPHGVTRHFSDVFSLFVGQGRRFSVAAVAAATGIPERTLKSYQPGGGATPGLENLLLLIAFLPVEFAAALLAPAGITEVVKPGDKPDGASSYALNAELGGLVNHFAQALADGRIDASEERAALQPARALHARLSEWIARLEGRAGGPR